MAALDRAVAHPEHGDAAVVPEQLGLDVPGPLEIALAEDRVVPEGGLGLALRGGERLVELGRASGRRASRGRRRRPRP